MVWELIQNNGYAFEETLMHEIDQIGVYKEIAARTKLMDIGEYIKSMPLLISGAIKVSREDTDGNELLLYFFRIWRYLRYDPHLLYGSFEKRDQGCRRNRL